MASAKFNKYGITDQQQAFADEYIINPSNATQAAIKAGYAPVGARRQASRLLTNVHIQKYLEQRRKEIESNKIADQKEVLEFWTAGMRGERKEKTALSGPRGVEVVETPISERDRNKNAELFAKATGMFIDRQEITNTQPIIISSIKPDDDENIEVSDDESNDTDS